MAASPSCTGTVWASCACPTPGPTRFGKAAALIASKGGSKQAAAKTYLAMRSKQKAAEAYLAARKANKGAEAAGGGTSGGTAAGGKAADEDDS